MKVMEPLIKQLTKMIKEGYDLGKRELPDIAKEILHFYTWGNILQIVASLSVALLFTYWGLSLYSTKDHSDNWVGIMAFSILATIAYTSAYCGLIDLLQVVIAPKLFLLNTLSNFINKED